MTTSTTQLAPSDFTEAWGRENIGDGMPSPEVLRETARALHAVQEFLVEPIAHALKELTTGVQVAAHMDVGPDDVSPWFERTPENERVVGHEDIGRLIVWTDELRKDIGFLFDSIVEITLLAHEDLHEIAEGYIPDGAALEDERYNARLRRFHGLAEGF